jgi:hypothetical protein
MAIFFVILGLLLAFPGLWLLCRGLWPRAVAGAAEACGAGLVKPFLLGLPVTIATVFVAAALSRFGSAGKIASVGAVCLYLMIANCGVAGLAVVVGERLGFDAGNKKTESPWRAIVRGGAALGLASLLPILGWFVIFPTSVTVGCGASLLTRLRKISAARESRRFPSVSPAESEELRVSSPLDASGPYGANR